MTILAVLAVLLVLLVGGVMVLSGNDIARYRRLKRM
ncbi:MAG: hypothetical protein QOF96_276 [Actinomycetota bacterium]|jgi:hypothetical protein|nr:hypothetical protein [Actinomycetota bacterium]MDQ1565396.1 hypothetical protein [Actinomycetota bacterium]